MTQSPSNHTSSPSASSGRSVTLELSLELLSAIEDFREKTGAPNRSAVIEKVLADLFLGGEA